jgi:hypothetical protein
MTRARCEDKTEGDIMSEQQPETYSIADAERIEAALEELWRQGREQ